MAKRTMTQIAGDLIVICRSFKHPNLYMCVEYAGHVDALYVYIANRSDHVSQIRFSIYLDQFTVEKMKLFVKGIKTITNALNNGVNIVAYLPFYGVLQNWNKNTDNLVESERMCLNEKKNVSH